MLRTALIGLTLALATAGSAQAACDRACLKMALDGYLAAVIAHDPGKAGLARAHRTTENGKVAKAGEGVWTSLTALGSVQRRYFDPVSGQAAYFGLLQEGDKPALATLRIKMDGAKIAEAEWTISRPRADGPQLNAPGAYAADLIAAPPSDMPLPKAERDSREVLLATAKTYFESVARHDGTILKQADGCLRIENGGQAAGPPVRVRDPNRRGPNFIDCKDKMETFGTTIADATNRRFPLVDEEAGMVLGMAIFQRPPGRVGASGQPMARNLLTEYFAIRKGLLTGVYAVGVSMPNESPNDPGWPS